MDEETPLQQHVQELRRLLESLTKALGLDESHGHGGHGVLHALGPVNVAQTAQEFAAATRGITAILHAYRSSLLASAGSDEDARRRSAVKRQLRTLNSLRDQHAGLEARLARCEARLLSFALAQMPQRYKGLVHVLQTEASALSLLCSVDDDAQQIQLVSAALSVTVDMSNAASPRVVLSSASLPHADTQAPAVSASLSAMLARGAVNEFVALLRSLCADLTILAAAPGLCDALSALQDDITRIHDAEAAQHHDPAALLNFGHGLHARAANAVVTRSVVFAPPRIQLACRDASRPLSLLVAAKQSPPVLSFTLTIEQAATSTALAIASQVADVDASALPARVTAAVLQDADQVTAGYHLVLLFDSPVPVLATTMRLLLHAAATGVASARDAAALPPPLFALDLLLRPVHASSAVFRYAGPRLLGYALHRLPLRHTAHLAAVLAVLRQQCAFNELYTSCFTPLPMDAAGAAAETPRRSGIVEVTSMDAPAHLGVSMVLQPDRPSRTLVSLSIAVALHGKLSVSLSCPASRSAVPIASDAYLSAVLSSTMSVPLLVDALCRCAHPVDAQQLKRSRPAPSQHLAC